MTLNPADNAGGDNKLPAVEHHRKTSRRLIRQAGYELEKRGDRVQACDKASVAVAHGVKAVAAARHWRSDSHNYRRRIVNLLADEYGQPELTVLQDVADKLRDNFYEDTMYDSEVQDRLAFLADQLATFMGLLAREPNPDFIPTTQQERMLSRLCLTAEEIADLRAMEYPPPPPEDGELAEED